MPMTKMVAGKRSRLTSAVEQLSIIRNTIIAAENRAMAVDGPVPKTIEMMDDADIGRIYKAAVKGLKDLEQFR